MTSRTDNPAEVGIHVFERAGLGKAPFRCVGFDECFIAHPDGTTQAGTSCDYCHTGIRYTCIIRSRDGRTFKVGTDCVAKTGDAGLIRSYKTHPAVRAAQRAKAQAKDKAVIAEWNALFGDPAIVAKLTAIMVPGRPWVPGEQVSLHDEFKRVWGMCGAKGRSSNLKALKQRLAEMQR
jgi:hypothetical protein